MDFGNYAGGIPYEVKVSVVDLRIIYYHLTSDHQIWFVTIYGKDETTDLTVEEKRILKRAIQTELAARRLEQ